MQSRVRSMPMVTLVVMVGVTSTHAFAQGKPATGPRTLEECYLQIAAAKQDADMAAVARDLCEAVFKPGQRSLFVHDKASGHCVEWWLDRRGRYENHLQSCALEPVGDAAWTLACQYKDTPSRITLVTLRAAGDSYQRDGELVGVDPGPMFKTMAACIRSKVGK